MKKITKLLMTGLFIATLSSCSKSGSNDVSLTVDLSATVDGSAKDTKSVSALKSGTSLVITSPLSIANNEALVLSISNFTGSGDYPITATSSNVTAYYSNGTNYATNIFIAISGDIKITSITSTNIIGTFNFTSTNTSGTTKVISGGQFTSTLTTQ